MPKSTQRSAKQKAAWKKLSPWMKRKIRKAPLSIWARRIRKEFDAKCAWCSKKRSLEAHHIYFKHLYPSKSEDLDNGLCLCIKCHDKIHTLYIQNQEEYWILINKLVVSRNKMKSISKKKRNPSLSTYTSYYYVLEEL